MTHYDISYKNLDRRAADEKAIKDIQNYLTLQQWRAMMELVANGHTAEQFNIAFGFVGIVGYPFHAFCRRYCMASYRAWMRSGDDPVLTDEEGFPIAGGVRDVETSNA